MKYSVAYYEVDRAFGGHQDGGWWYTYELPLEGRKVRYFDNEEDAHTACNSINALVDVLVNKFRRPISSVLSEGKVRAIVREGEPSMYPEEEPHYC